MTDSLNFEANKEEEKEALLTEIEKMLDGMQFTPILAMKIGLLIKFK